MLPLYKYLLNSVEHLPQIAFLCRGCGRPQPGLILHRWRSGSAPGTRTWPPWHSLSKHISIEEGDRDSLLLSGSFSQFHNHKAHNPHNPHRSSTRVEDNSN